VANYHFTEKSEHDLEEMIDYTLQQWGTLQAQAYLEELDIRGQLLADNPGLGIERNSIHEGLLSFPYESHILYYVKQAHDIIILRVLHQSMDPIKHF